MLKGWPSKDFLYFESFIAALSRTREKKEEQKRNLKCARKFKNTRFLRGDDEDGERKYASAAPTETIAIPPITILLLSIPYDPIFFGQMIWVFK